MSVLGWIFFGLIAGFIASKIVNRQGEGCFLNIALGLVGALVGGELFSLLGTPIYWHFFSWKSMLAAILGAVIVLFLYHAVTGSRTLR